MPNYVIYIISHNQSPIGSGYTVTIEDPTRPVGSSTHLRLLTGDEVIEHLQAALPPLFQGTDVLVAYEGANYSTAANAFAAIEEARPRWDVLNTSTP